MILYAGRTNRPGKMVKRIEAIEFVEDIGAVYQGEGSYNEDREYFGELANI